jgi:type VI secretion system lysozyme-like protein
MALFDKFRTASSSKGRTEAQSVIESLSEILNTRRGYGSFLDNFGIMDLSDRISRQQIALAVVREVREVISNYEQRITVGEIVEVPQVHPTRMSFSIQCSFGEEKLPLQMVFDSSLSTFELGTS